MLADVMNRKWRVGLLKKTPIEKKEEKKKSQRERGVAEGRLVTEERGADRFFMEKT